MYLNSNVFLNQLMKMMKNRVSSEERISFPWTACISAFLRPTKYLFPLFLKAFYWEKHISLQTMESDSELCLTSSIFIFEFMLHQSSPAFQSTGPQTKRPTVFIWLGCPRRLATPTMFLSVERPQVVFAVFLLLSVAL